MIDYKYVEVKWLDATGENSVIDIEDALKMKPARVTSHGYLIKDTIGFIIIAGTKYDDGMVSELVCIPKKWILKISTIKKKK